MSKFFTEKDIENYKQCFKLYANEGFVSSAEKLGFIMRSLNFTPTRNELNKYFNNYKKEDRQIDFAEFLNILHTHIESENANQEILNAFKAYDNKKMGYLTVNELRSILTLSGEKLSHKDVDMIIQEVNGYKKDGIINYENLVKTLSKPISDF